ncbi:LD-carboxypeptidase [bacterium K02(2017)]|nr:LD-carboxypeptidase [bacterium K02(2017)]
MQTPLLPPKLKKNDTIAYFSPSSPATVFAPRRYERALVYLKGKGFKLKAGSLTGKSDFYRSGTIKERANELNQLIRDPDVKCIISTIGGMNSNSILPYIDYQSLLKDPKIICGYSDMTAILLAIYAKTGLITFYGPALIASFGEFSPLVDETYKSFDSLLCKANKPPYTYAVPHYWTDQRLNWETQNKAKELFSNHIEFRGEGIISGRLIGGNLNTMTALWDSPYMPEVKTGDILFLEDGLKDISTMERLFSFLKINGTFNKIAAIVLGKHECFDDLKTKRRPLEVLNEVLDDINMPMVIDWDASHTHPMLTMPLGLKVSLDFKKQKIQIEEPWVLDN